MGLLKLYRVTKETYHEGEVMMPNATYADDFQEDKLKIENALNSQSPFGERKKYLFLFDRLESAFLYLIKCTNGAAIYRVEAECRDLVAKCDMNFIDGMTYLLRSLKEKSVPEEHGDSLITAFAKEYWDHGKTFLPCNEYLFQKATTVRNIFSVNPKQWQQLLKEYKEIGCNVLGMKDFQDLFKAEYFEKDSEKALE